MMKRCNAFDYFFSLIVTPFVLSPIGILFWASTWNIVVFYTYPEERDLLASFGINLALLILFMVPLYLLQDWLGIWHTRLLKRNSQSSPSCYLFRLDFHFRNLFNYLLATAQIIQWRLYWDCWTELLCAIDLFRFGYFLCMSLLFVAFHLALVQDPWDNYVQGVPFHMEITDNYERYFVQPIMVRIRRSRLKEIFLNLFLNEFIEQFVIIVAWVGIWDTFDTGATELIMLVDSDKWRDENGTLVAERFPTPCTDPSWEMASPYYWYSYLASGLVGYAIYYYVIAHREYTCSRRHQRPRKRRRPRKQRHSFRFSRDDVWNAFMAFLTFVGQVAIWRTVWDPFDYAMSVIVSPQVRILAMWGTHIITAIIMCLSGFGQDLPGPLPNSNDFSDNEHDTKSTQTNIDDCIITKF